MSLAESPPQVVVKSSDRISPSPPPTAIRTIPLSIIDATVLNFSPCAAVWFFDASPSPDSAPSPTLLKSALKQTLVFYSEWCGQLQRTPYNPKGHHSERYGRLQIVLNPPLNPGVELVHAEASVSLAWIVPGVINRAVGGLRAWNAVSLSSMQLLPTIALASEKIDDPAGRPCLAVQLTTFACGGTAIGIKLAHPLADAIALGCFARDWANATRQLLDHQPPRTCIPIFAPQLLDREAAGDIDAPNPDLKLLEIARALPLHRYDWWASVNGCPFDPDATKIPEELDPKTIGPPDTVMPWAEWDVAAPVSHYVLHFTGLELTRIWQEASSEAAPVSRTEALLAHLWGCINLARGLEEDEKPVHLDVSLGLRSRLGMSPKFIGSFIMIADVASTASRVCKDSLATKAAQLRSTLAKFDASAVATCLHSAAYEVSPQRLWQAFLGKRHTLVTSWVHSNVHDVDFGFGSPPRYVEAAMPNVDGLVAVIEAPAGSPTGERRGHWSDDGIDVSISLEVKAMKKFLEDEHLWKYGTKY